MLRRISGGGRSTSSTSSAATPGRRTLDVLLAKALCTLPLNEGIVGGTSGGTSGSGAHEALEIGDLYRISEEGRCWQSGGRAGGGRGCCVVLLLGFASSGMRSGLRWHLCDAVHSACRRGGSCGVMPASQKGHPV